MAEVSNRKNKMGDRKASFRQAMNDAGGICRGGGRDTDEARELCWRRKGRSKKGKGKGGKIGEYQRVTWKGDLPRRSFNWPERQTDVDRRETVGFLISRRDEKD